MGAVTLTHGAREYTALLAQITADPDLVDLMWEHAESRPTELDVPGTYWSVALVDGSPTAWCAACVQGDGTLRCHSNYERLGYRHRGLYAAAYRERHTTVITPSGLPAVTYLFAQPIPLHEADGWVRTGVAGVSCEAGEPHDWWELRRAPG